MQTRKIRRFLEPSNHDVILALLTKKTDLGVVIGDYEVEVKPSKGKVKTMYDINLLTPPTNLYRNIGLFDTAKKIVEVLILSKERKQDKIKELLDLDKKCLGFILEMELNQIQLERLDEDNDIRYDIIKAKMSGKNRQIEQTRNRIKNFEVR